MEIGKATGFGGEKTTAVAGVASSGEDEDAMGEGNQRCGRKILVPAAGLEPATP